MMTPARKLFAPGQLFTPVPGFAKIPAALERAGRTRVIVYSTLLAGTLAYALYALVLFPLSQRQEEQQARLASLESENQMNRAVAAERVAFQQEFRRAVLGYRSARELLPTKLEVSNVLSQVQAAATAHRVLLTGFDSISKKDVRSPAASKLYEREVPAVVAGPYANVVDFFRAVTHLSRLVEIPEFALTSLRDRVSVSFKLIAYYAPPPDELPALPPEFQQLLDVPNDLRQAPADTKEKTHAP